MAQSAVRCDTMFLDPMADLRRAPTDESMLNQSVDAGLALLRPSNPASPNHLDALIDNPVTK